MVTLDISNELLDVIEPKMAESQPQAGAGGQAGNNANVQNEAPQVARVAVKLAPFWPDKANHWFFMAEAQFVLGQVTKEETKFAHVVTQLDSVTADQVLDILSDPPVDPYTALKARLTKTYAITDSEKASQIIDMDGLGDKTPSQCMTTMLNLVPTGEEPGFLFREHYLRQLQTPEPSLSRPPTLVPTGPPSWSWPWRRTSTSRQSEHGFRQWRLLQVPGPRLAPSAAPRASPL